MKNTKAKQRGVFEKVPGSGIQWIRFADRSGKIRREIAGTMSAATTLYRKRKTEVLQGKKLPENLRQRAVLFSELATDALQYSKTHKRSHRQDKYRMKPLVAEFGNRVADSISSPELANWLSTHAEENDWKPATVNRFKALLSLTYRLGIESKKVSVNPASRTLKRKLENNERVRFLNQFPPSKTTVDYLKPCTDEESRLRAVISAEFPEHMPEFEIAMHTGMRPSEQYSLTWDKVDLTRGFITIVRSKNGNPRHIPLNSVALAAFKTLQKRSGNAVFVTMKGETLHGYKHWFDPAVEKAGVEDFTWYCLRHTFASRLVMKGVDLRTVQELMGHRNIQMTCRYAHLAPEHKQAAVEKLCEVAVPTGDTAAKKRRARVIPMQRAEGRRTRTHDAVTDTGTDTSFSVSL